jgi:hypothetical protein
VDTALLADQAADSAMLANKQPTNCCTFPILIVISTGMGSTSGSAMHDTATGMCIGVATLGLFLSASLHKCR